MLERDAIYTATKRVTPRSIENHVGALRTRHGVHSISMVTEAELMSVVSSIMKTSIGHSGGFGDAVCHRHLSTIVRNYSSPSRRLYFCPDALAEHTQEISRSTMSAQTQPSPGPEESGTEELYFSYGSNMHLQQMAARCPDSTLFAKGILRNYKWQINNRGGANVTKGNLEDFVEGILFTVSPNDVQALRRYEGTEQQFYEERKLDVEVECLLDRTLEGWNTADAAESLAQCRSGIGLKNPYTLANLTISGQIRIHSDSAAEDLRGKSSRSKAGEQGGKNVSRKALIYISYKHQLPGDIREEYIGRMQLAMADAGVLGVSKSYLETSLHPLVFGERAGARLDEVPYPHQKATPMATSPEKTREELEA
ncbi:MAG: hypothetical protein Q9195_001369 [Heterodermia aff. obscurata]